MAQNPYTPRIVRFSLDLDVEQRNFLRYFAAHNELSGSILMRAMIHILQTDPEFGDRVLDLIYITPESEVEEVEDDESLAGFDEES